MVTQATQQGYTLDLAPDERDALIGALEVAVGLSRGEPVLTLRCLLTDAEVGTLDRLADALCLVETAS